MQVQHIIFDLGNVLVNIHPEKAMKGFMGACGLTEEQVKSFYLSQLHLDFMSGKYTGEEFYQTMSQKFDCQIPLQQFKEIWHLVIGAPKPGIPELVKTLAEHYTLSVLSNTDPWHWEFVKDRDSYLDNFRHYFLSFAMGVNKPDEKIFRLVLKELGTQPDNCVFIDDTEENTLAAQKLGFKTIWAANPEEIREKLAQFVTINL